MKKIFDDGILEATLYPSNWVFMRWIQNKHGRLQKALIKDLIHVEQLILQSKLNGWFTQSDLVHEDFHKLLVKCGAIPKVIVGEDQVFVKPISKLEDLHRKAVV